MAAMPLRKLGSQGLQVPSAGLGMMGVSAFYYNTPEDEASGLAAMDKAVELSHPSPAFIDTAWIYQAPDGRTNEAVVAKAIAKHGRDKFIIATKFGIKFDPATGLSFDSSPENIKAQLADSLARLGTDYIDLYYQHRVDPATPMETVAGVFKELHAAGKIKYAGLSECTPAELRRAHAVFPITAVQAEWSLQTRDLEAPGTLLDTCKELGVGIVAYSPLGRGLLSATFTKREDLQPSDWRLTQPRFSEEAFARNAAKAAKLQELAARKGCTPAQLALAWLLSKWDGVVPIPGTKSAARVAENFGAVRLALSAAEVAEIEASVPEASEERYSGMYGTWTSRL